VLEHHRYANATTGVVECNDRSDRNAGVVRERDSARDSDPDGSSGNADADAAADRNAIVRSDADSDSDSGANAVGFIDDR
jgi:hypothetical protein